MVSLAAAAGTVAEVEEDMEVVPSAGVVVSPRSELEESQELWEKSLRQPVGLQHAP
jgi:hypothetical protein